MGIPVYFFYLYNYIAQAIWSVIISRIFGAIRNFMTAVIDCIPIPTVISIINEPAEKYVKPLISSQICSGLKKYWKMMQYMHYHVHEQLMTYLSCQDTYILFGCNLWQVEALKSLIVVPDLLERRICLWIDLQVARSTTCTIILVHFLKKSKGIYLTFGFHDAFKLDKSTSSTRISINTGREWLVNDTSFAVTKLVLHVLHAWWVPCWAELICFGFNKKKE